MKIKNFAKIMSVTLLAIACTSPSMRRGPASKELSASRVFDKGVGPIVEPTVETPVIERLIVDNQVVWNLATNPQGRAVLTAGQTVTLEGKNFGDGPDVDLSKVVVGNVRALERDLTMYRGVVNPLDVLILRNIFHETADPSRVGSVSWPQVWNKDVTEWTPTRIILKIPVTASRGPISVQVQKKLGVVMDADGRPHLVPDPITERVTGYGSYGGPEHADLQLGIYGSPVTSSGVDVTINNPTFAASVESGKKIYWAFDYNIGFTHALLGVNWEAILSGKAQDRVMGGLFDPVEKIGAIYSDSVKDSVPDIVFQNIEYNPSPMPAPFWKFSQKASIQPTAWVGYVQAKSLPLDPLHPNAYHIGFSCVTCHAAPITYDDGSGRQITRLFNGIPNPKWSMKFATVGPMSGVRGPEASGPDNEFPQLVDKSQLLYAIYPGTADMTLIRSAYEKGAFYHNDFYYSPTAIPIITEHTPVRRALSRGETIAGFEGSYIHSEEPDGAFGAHTAQAIKDFTTYMSTIDSDHELLIKIGLYKWLKFKGKLGEVKGASEGEFIKSAGPASYPALADKIDAGKRVFQRDCQSCHAPNYGTNTDENMIPLAKVGSFFSPTKWQRQQGSMRTAMIRELYWVQRRGLLHDGHIRSSDSEHADSASRLVDPERCREGSTLYNSLYTLTPTTYKNAFRIPKGNSEQERATRQQFYFVDLPDGWGTPDDHQYLYWDYQKMRTSFGVTEMGAGQPTPLPTTPHPYCVQEAADADSLVHYLMTL